MAGFPSGSVNVYSSKYVKGWQLEESNLYWD